MRWAHALGQHQAAEPILRATEPRRAETVEAKALRRAQGHRIRGVSVSDDDASRGDDLEERTRQHNSNLVSLIEAVGGILAASADLLARLQQILGRNTPPDSNQGTPPAS